MSRDLLHLNVIQMEYVHVNLMSLVKNAMIAFLVTFHSLNAMQVIIYIILNNYECFFTLKLYVFCLVCDCDLQGSVSISCNSKGKCPCKPNVIGDKCSECKPGHVLFPECYGNYSHFIGKFVFKCVYFWKQSILLKQNM